MIGKMERAEQAAGKSAFEHQFDHREKIETAGGTAETVDIRPERRSDEPPVLLAPAWACTLPIYEPTIEELVNDGRRVISLNHPRYGGVLNESEKILCSEYPEEEVRKGATIADIIRAKGLEETEVIAHSEGAANAGLAALMLAREARDRGMPPPISRIVMFGPLGLIGKDSLSRLASGFAAQGAEKPTLGEILPSPETSEEERRRTGTEHATPIMYPEIGENPEAKAAIVGEGKISTVMKELAKYATANPIRSAKEVWGMANTQIDDLISELREMGVQVVIMSGVDDPVFDTKTMAERLKRGSLDGFLSVRGGHGQLGENPERYAIVANQMLRNLRNKKTTADTSA